MDAVARTGYVVNPIASSLRSGRSTIVTVFTASLQNPHFAAATQGTIDAFEGSRFQLMFAQTGYSEQLRAEVVESSMPFRPAGVMFTGLVRDQATREAVGRLGVPVIEMWGDGIAAIDMLVGSSTLEGGRLMGQHFGGRGYRHIAYCGHTVDRGGDRLAGFRAGLEQFGASVELVLPLEGTRTFADGMAALPNILAQMPACDAIFFGTDILAVGAIIAAHKHGIKIPDQVALAGYGDLEFAAHIDPSLTSIDVSDYEMGKLAGTMLRQRLEDGRVDEPVVHVPVRLRARQSTAK